MAAPKSRRQILTSNVNRLSRAPFGLVTSLVGLSKFGRHSRRSSTLRSECVTSADDLSPVHGISTVGLERTAFRVNNFDLLRILAATQVLIVHCMDRFEIPVPDWLNWFPGVPIFFVISGFLVSASYRRQDEIGKYLKNRILRIYPGLWVCIGLTFIVTTLLGYRPTHTLDFIWLPSQLLGFIYTPGYLRHFGAGSYNGSLWTIPIELQFYLLLPLLYIAKRRLQIKNLEAILLVFFIAINLTLSYELPGFGRTQETMIGKLIRYTFVSSFYLFLLGVALQSVEAFKSKLIAGKALYWITAYGLLRVALSDDSPITTAISYLVLGVSAVSAAYTFPRASALILRGQDISYGVYIYHGLLINLLLELTKRRSAYDVGLVILAAVAFGSLSWKFIEKPFLLKKLRTTAAISKEVILPSSTPSLTKCSNARV